MAEILLTELRNADIDWMVNTGQRSQIAAGTVLIRPCEPPDAVHLLLDGMLAITAPQAEVSASNVGSVGSIQTINDVIIELTRGEIVGEALLFNLRPVAAIVCATQNSTILSLSQQQLTTKLRQDIDFAVHFYRTIALLLAARLQRVLETLGQLQLNEEPPLKEALIAFGELRDGDIDWLISVGQMQQLAANKVLIHAGRPVDALYIVLDGMLSIALPGANYDPLAFCCEGLENNLKSLQRVSNLSSGEIAGAVSFLTARPHPTTLQAIDDALVWAIPRQQLSAKLQQDMGFAARFYRILAIQISNSLQTLLSYMGCNRHVHQQHQSMNEEMEYDDELNVDALEQYSQGAARFNWMLKRLGVSH